MNEHIYKKIEITGSSVTGSDDAIQNALSKAAETIKHMDWFEVTEIRGQIDKSGKVEYWQVSLKIGFLIDPK